MGALTRKDRRSAVLQMVQGRQRPHWGTDPGEFDPDHVERVVDGVDRLFGEGAPFEVDMRGWQNMPRAPVMVVSNHSGGSTIPDAWGLLYGWYRHFGTERPLHVLAHEIILASRWSGRFFGRAGVLRASRDRAMHVLERWKRDILVMPGGDRDLWRPFTRRYRAEFAGHRGYARMALRVGVPIVPVANAGPHETLMVLTDGRAIARALRLHDLVRIDVFPIHLSLPWGLGIGPLPHIPIPRKLRYRIGRPIRPPAHVRPGEEPTQAEVDALDRRVRTSMNQLLYRLQHDAARSRRRGRP